VELLGVSTVHGNASLDQTTLNARATLEAIGKRDVKVGAHKPIKRVAVSAADIHGNDSTRAQKSPCTDAGQANPVWMALRFFQTPWNLQPPMSILSKPSTGL
jgi:inosine-uridine nucleoside N-ribohydrolase